MQSQFSLVLSLFRYLILSAELRNDSVHLINFRLNFVVMASSNPGSLSCQLASDSTFVLENLTFIAESFKRIIVQQEHSWKKWESPESFKSDLREVLSTFRVLDTRDKLLTAASAALWILANVHYTEHHLNPKDDEIWAQVPQILKDLAKELVKPAKEPSASDVASMQKAVAEVITEIPKDPLFAKLLDSSKSHPAQRGRDKLAVVKDNSDVQNYKVEVEAQLKEAQKVLPILLKRLQPLDPLVHVEVKRFDRAMVKAQSEKYGGDVTQVLDYLRSSMTIHVRPGDSAADVLAAFHKVTESLSGRIVRMKLFPDEKGGLSRVLLDLEFDFHICELIVFFRYAGYDEHYWVFKHTMFEMSEKENRNADRPKEHVIRVLMDLLAKTGIVLDDDFLKHQIVKRVMFEKLKEVVDITETGVRLSLTESLRNGNKELKTMCFKTQLKTNDEGFTFASFKSIPDPKRYV